MPAPSDAPFYAPLKTSLVLQNGSGNPTFTRATAATTFNTDGKLINIPSGAVRFAGARPVVNWFSDSSKMATSSAWTATNFTKTAVLGPDGVTSDGCLITCTANSGSFITIIYDPTVLGGNIRTFKFLYKPGTATWIRLFFYDSNSSNRVTIWFNAITNAIGTVSTGGTGWSLNSYGLTASTTYSGWYEIYVVVTSPITGSPHAMTINFSGVNGSVDYTNVNGQYFTLARPQLENSTGRTDRTPSEYVATGLAAPWHGAGADGVKYFATNKDGSLIADSALQGVIVEPTAITNSLLSSRLLSVVTGSIAWGSSTNAGTEKVINGTFDTDLSGWTAGDGTGATITWNNGTVSCYAGGVNSNVLLRQTITGLTVGKTYTVTVNFLSSTPSQCAVYISYAPGYATAPFAATPYTAKVTFIAGASTLSLHLVGGNASATAVIDNVSIKEADIQITNDTGIDNQANACSVLTATTNNATILQTIYIDATAGSFGFYIKRSVGSGSIYITRDGGANWTDITSSINSSAFSLVKIENTSVLNPQVGFKISTSGDAIIVDGGMNHSGAQLSKYPIFTTSATVTRNADVLTYQTSGNFSNTAGTMMATVSRDDWTVGNGSVIGKSGFGLITSDANSGVQAKDGTNTVSGPTGNPVSLRRIGLRYSGTTLEAFAGGVLGTAGSYDGSFNLTTIGIAPEVTCSVRDVSIWQTSLADITDSAALSGYSLTSSLNSIQLGPFNYNLSGQGLTSNLQSLSRTNSAGFTVPLRTSLIPTNGSGNPTFTRATAATTFNTENNLVNIPSGAVRFAGARPVVNWFKDSSIMATSSSWIATNFTKTAVLGPDGVTSDGCLITCTANSGSFITIIYDPTVLGGNIRTYKFLYKPGTATWIRLFFYDNSLSNRVTIWFNATTNVIGTVSTGGTGWSLNSYGLTASTTYSGWYEIYVVATSPITGSPHSMTINFSGVNGTVDYTNVNGQYFTIAYPQLENSTGRTDKTPSEYIATGLSAPYYGAGADGVKYFATNKDGSVIADSALQGVIIEPVAITNNLLGSRLLSVVTGSIPWGSSTNAGTEKVINGTFDTDTSGWTAGPGTGATITWNNGTVSCYSGTDQNVLIRQSITGLTVGKTYTVTADFLSSTPSKCAVYISYAPGYATAPFITTPYTANVTFIAGASTLSLQLVGGTASATAVIDNVSMKEADVQITNDTGIDNQANACSVLTATTNNATILQTIYIDATAGSFGFYVKRKTGTGSIYITRDGGANWTDITSSINSSTFSLVKIENTPVLNPQVGFKISTNGDAIIVDGGMNHSGAQLSKYPIFTTSASSTRNADVLTYQTSGNFSDTAGTVIAAVTRDDWTVGNGSVIGKSGFGLITSSTNSGVQAKDGTNTVSGPAGSPVSLRKLGLRYSGTTLEAFAGGVLGTAGSYDGSFNLTTIGIAPEVTCSVRDVNIQQTSLADIVDSAALSGYSLTSSLNSVQLGPFNYNLSGQGLTSNLQTINSLLQKNILGQLPVSLSENSLSLYQESQLTSQSLLLNQAYIFNAIFLMLVGQSTSVSLNSIINDSQIRLSGFENTILQNDIMSELNTALSGFDMIANLENLGISFVVDMTGQELATNINSIQSYFERAISGNEVIIGQYSISGAFESSLTGLNNSVDDGILQSNITKGITGTSLIVHKDIVNARIIDQYFLKNKPIIILSF